MEKIKNWFKREWNALHDSPIKTAFAIGIIATAIVLVTIIATKSYMADGFRDNVLVESIGMLLDIFVIVIVLQWLDKLREKKQQIARWHEEIDDFRDWNSEDARVRIVGLIKRLNKLGVTDIDLSYAHLAKVNIAHSKLMGAKLRRANLKGAKLRRANLKGASLEGASLEGASLGGASLEGANLVDARLSGTHIEWVNLVKAKLVRAKLDGANLEGTKLGGADLEGANLEGASLMMADLEGAKGLTAEMLAHAKTLFGANLDAALKQELKESHSYLFEVPWAMESCPHCFEPPE